MVNGKWTQLAFRESLFITGEVVPFTIYHSPFTN